jgi:hypothetical protein
MGYKKTKARKQELGGLEDEFDDSEPLPTLTDYELSEFEEWINDFKEEKNIFYPKPATIHPINIRKAMYSFGATTSNGSVIVRVIDTDRFGNPTRYQTPTMYDKFWNKLDQLTKRSARRSYGEAKRIEGYEEMAQTMNVADDLIEQEL